MLYPNKPLNVGTLRKANKVNAKSKGFNSSYSPSGEGQPIFLKKLQFISPRYMQDSSSDPNPIFKFSSLENASQEVGKEALKGTKTPAHDQQGKKENSEASTKVP